MDLSKKYPIPSREEEDVEQALGQLWAMLEQGEVQPDAIRAAVESSIRPGIIEELIQKGLARQGQSLELTPLGNSVGQSLARRHRLAERLLKDVLTVAEEQIDPNACRMEHILTADVEQAICIMLGHPKACPHGLTIPPGPCCQAALEKTGPIVLPLRAFKPGESGRVAYLSPQHRPALHRLLALGLVPGALIRVEQVFPAFVIAIGPALLALEESLAEHIFVRRKTRVAGLLQR
ncbi:MAG: metal-dependent transcriptional regulator [Elusimicrobia bacterium]|nr:metal-dependent transcriptional regulator [Elusimicrobiota bacterium]